MTPGTCCSAGLTITNQLQGLQAPSTATLLEVYNVSAWSASAAAAERSRRSPPPSLEHLTNLRAVSVLHVRRGLEPCLPRLPASVRTLTLDAGSGFAGCEAATADCMTHSEQMSAWQRSAELQAVDVRLAASKASVPHPYAACILG